METFIIYYYFFKKTKAVKIQKSPLSNFLGDTETEN